MYRGERVKVHCPDLVVRAAQITSEPDTWFSQPAKVQVKGVTVTGYVTGGENGLEFRPYLYRKNHHLLEVKNG